MRDMQSLEHQSCRYEICERLLGGRCLVMCTIQPPRRLAELRMNSFISPRILSIASIGTLGGLWFRYRDLQTAHLERAAYLAEQAAHFERMQKPHYIWAWIIAGLIVAGILFGLYELLVFAASKLLSNGRSGSDSLGT
jgi:hypothetical protein